MSLKLYFIAFTDDEDHNWDLFVWAGDTEQARKIYFDTWKISSDEEEIGTVFEVPMTPPAEPKALGWHVDIRQS